MGVVGVEARWCTDRQVVKAEPVEVTVGLPGGREVVHVADWWEFHDGHTLNVYLGDDLVMSYPQGQWTKCFGLGVDVTEEDVVGHRIS